MRSEGRPPLGARERFVVLAPLRIETRALRRVEPCLPVAVVGMGSRAGPAAARFVRPRDQRALVVLAGFGGGVREDAEAGDVVVASGLLDLRGDQARRAPAIRSLPSREARTLRDALERRGLRATLGTLATVGRLAGPRTRALAASWGVEALDRESVPVAEAVAPRPVVVARVLLDVPGGELASLGTLRRYRRARRSLAEVGAVLAQLGGGRSVEVEKENVGRCRFP
jgi:nucleoside phosphorylase